MLQFLKDAKKVGLNTGIAIWPGKVVDAADLDFDSDEDEDGEPTEVIMPIRGIVANLFVCRICHHLWMIIGWHLSPLSQSAPRTIR